MTRKLFQWLFWFCRKVDKDNGEEVEYAESSDPDGRDMSRHNWHSSKTTHTRWFYSDLSGCRVVRIGQFHLGIDEEQFDNDPGRFFIKCPWARGPYILNWGQFKYVTKRWIKRKTTHWLFWPKLLIQHPGVILEAYNYYVLGKKNTDLPI